VAEAQECYYLDGARNQQGPVPGDEFARLVRAGTIRRDTLVWHAGMPDWQPAGQVSEFASLFAQVPPPRPSVAPAPPPPSFPAASPMQRMAPNPGPYAAQAARAPAAQYAPAGAQYASGGPQYAPGGSMGFGGAISTCFRKYVDFRGRAARPEYWFWILFYTLLVIGTSILDAIIVGVGSSAAVLTLLAGLALFLPSLAVAVRRLHDQDYSGWMILLGFIPLIGWIIVLVLMCLRGTPGPNRFGPEPGAASVAETFS